VKKISGEAKHFSFLNFEVKNTTGVVTNLWPLTIVIQRLAIANQLIALSGNCHSAIGNCHTAIGNYHRAQCSEWQLPISD